MGWMEDLIKSIRNATQGGKRVGRHVSSNLPNRSTGRASVLQYGSTPGQRTYASGTTFAQGSKPVSGYFPGTTVFRGPQLTPEALRRTSPRWSGHQPPITSNASREAQALIARNNPGNDVLARYAREAGAGGGLVHQGPGGGGMGGRQIYGGPSSAGAGVVDTGISGPGAPPNTAPPGLSTKEKDDALRKEVEALLGLEFDPRQREAERMLEMLGITRKQTGDYFSQYQGQGTRAINEVYDLITKQEQGYKGDLEKFLGEQAAMMSTGALGSATAAGLGDTPLGEEFAREIARSAMTESQANAAMRGAQYSNFMKALQDTGFMRAQDVSEFQAGTGADFAEQLQSLLEAELGGRRELGDITKERGQAAVALTRDLERDIYERGREAEIDRLQAEQIRRQLGLSEQEFAWQREQDMFGRGLAERELSLQERMGAADIAKAKAEIAAAKGDESKVPSLTTMLNTSGYNPAVINTLQYVITRTPSDPEKVQRDYIANIQARQKRGEKISNQELMEGLEFLGLFFPS